MRILYIKKLLRFYVWLVVTQKQRRSNDVTSFFMMFFSSLSNPLQRLMQTMYIFPSFPSFFRSNKICNLVDFKIPKIETGVSCNVRCVACVRSSRCAAISWLIIKFPVSFFYYLILMGFEIRLKKRPSVISFS